MSSMTSHRWRPITVIQQREEEEEKNRSKENTQQTHCSCLAHNNDCDSLHHRKKKKGKEEKETEADGGSEACGEGTEIHQEKSCGIQRGEAAKTQTIEPKDKATDAANPPER